MLMDGRTAEQEIQGRNRHFSVLDLFCGTGALSHGIDRYSNNAFRTVAGVDSDKLACQTAASNAPRAQILCGDIRDMDPNQIVTNSGGPSIDLIVGGPPCQGFSSLRPTRGQSLQDPRNELYREFLRFVEHFQPAVFLMENVVGLINANGGDLLSSILYDAKKIGYSTEWKVLNAANYGVPQKRERVFIIGIRKRAFKNTKIMFPSPTHYFDGRVIGTRRKAHYVINRNAGKRAVSVWDAISDLPSLRSGEVSCGYATEPRNDYQLKRRERCGQLLKLHDAANHSEKILQIVRHAGSSISALPAGLVNSGYSSCYSRLEINEPATTVTVKFTSPASSKCIHPLDDRSITPREAARLQGFDDDFIFKGSKTHIASQIGNAVPPLFGAAFAPILAELMDSKASVEEY